MAVFVPLVDKENAPKAPTTGDEEKKPLPRDQVTGPFLYNNVVKLLNSMLTLSIKYTLFSLKWQISAKPIPPQHLSTLELKFTL